MLRLWWERIGETRASGIVKLMTSEVRNFPEIAQFYVDEVVAPSNQMLAEVIQRGVDRGARARERRRRRAPRPRATPPRR